VALALRTYNRLLKDGRFGYILIPTVKVDLFSIIDAVLQRYGSMVIKPASGGRGRGQIPGASLPANRQFFGSGFQYCFRGLYHGHGPLSADGVRWIEEQLAHKKQK
jgi:hypothetical protein